MSFREDNDAYEARLATQCDVVVADIKTKHKLMKTSAFMFLRATGLEQPQPEEPSTPRLNRFKFIRPPSRGDFEC
jgi:hypothetical protein